VLTCSIAALLGLGTAAPSPAALAAAEAQQSSRMRFEAMDANHDGRITRDEWKGSDRSFANHDWNGDGVLSEDEVRIGAQRTRDFGTADHRPNRYEQAISWTEQGFHDLDHNRDGRLTANEWHFDLETFRRIDRNRDNAISVSEFLGGDLDDDRDDRFDDLDWNNDGRVTRNEWHGSLEDFRWLDRNNDGVLSRYEVVGQQASFDNYDEFQGLDYNRNGTIERSEWHWSRPSFAELDTNRDGVLSRRELEGAGVTSGGGPASGPHQVRVNAQQRWTDTGLSVRAGDVVTINTSG
jgi:Ca2+-binding EF-hand superfamily protein